MPDSAPRAYPNLIHAVADGLDEVFNRGYYADKVVAQLLKRDSRWGSRDRAFIAETLYDCVRWWRLLSEIADSDRPEAVIAAYWAWRHELPLEVGGYPYIHPVEVERSLRLLDGERAVLESIPDWLDQLGEVELRQHWPSTLAALNRAADVYLRTNTLKVEREQLLKDLTSYGFELEAAADGPDAIRVIKRRNLWATQSFRAGHFEVQDIASQQVAPMLEVEPGMTVVDACAGAGGKSLHLAALMQNKGRLIALDTDERKLAQLKKRAKRAGVSNLDIRHITSSKIIKRLYGKADRVLLDVPCSGLGVLRRNPDAKWKLQPEFVEQVKVWQADILERYSRMAKADGAVVYATCSVLPSESEGQIEHFLGRDSSWTQLAERRLWPQDGFDGFYMTRLGQQSSKL